MKLIAAFAALASAAVVPADEHLAAEVLVDSVGQAQDVRGDVVVEEQNWD